MATIIFNKQLISETQACLSPRDRGYTLGHGLFETLLINKNTIPAFEYHWKRLNSSAPLLGISIPFAKEELLFMLKELIISNGLESKIAGARITISHGEADRGIWPIQTPTPNYLITVFAQPLSDKTYSALIVSIKKNEHSPTALIKSLSYLDNILAKQEALQQGFDEAILLNTAGKVADGSITNVFMVKNGLIITPPITDGALPGVLRAILLELDRNSFSIVEQSFNEQDLLDADEVFLTNALLGIKSLHKINRHSLSCFSCADALRDRLRMKGIIPLA